MLYEHWQGDGDTFLPKDHPQYAMLTENSTLIWTVKAPGWVEACTAWHEHMEWEPYVPMELNSDDPETIFDSL